ncbi:hypothetical protein EDB19DRAFT_2042887 [Suillus lakei]|nr:hypothetical protein EDB19DRAFT_2042887 [Suillus lakei]
MTLQYSGPSTFYTELAELPQPVSAHFIDDVARVTYSVRDHERNIKRSLTKTFTLDNHTTTHDSSEIKAFATSPSKSRQAILREANAKRFIEIWAGTQLEASLEVTNYHQAFLTDDFLSSLSFSPSETSLVYTAEASLNTDDDPYNKFRYTPHFGEPSRARKRPTLFLFCWTRSPAFTRATKQDLSLFALSLAQPTQTPVLFAQATFATEDTIFASGHEHTKDGRLLGAKGCFNRPMGIWQLTLPTLEGTLGTKLLCVASKLTPPHRSCRSPRVLYDHNHTPIKLFWFSNPIGGAHASCVSLESRDLVTGANNVLIDTVTEPTPSNDFPGLYTEYSMPSSPFLHRADGVYIVLQSIWRSRTTVLFIDTLSGVITDATKLGDGPLYSWTVHATDNKNQFICSRSTPTTPWEVLLGSFDQDGTLEWKVLDKLMLSSLAEEALNDLIPSIIPITARSPTETLVIQSKTSTSGSGPKPVCVTIPHGGPHTTSTTAFVPGYAALALEGYTLNIPNYTGSMGFGQTHIRNLLGHCGSIDVEDVVTSVEELVRRGISEKGRQVVTGGSHGGFIAAHRESHFRFASSFVFFSTQKHASDGSLFTFDDDDDTYFSCAHIVIGQHPTLFDAAILRNPVISAGEMAIGTDIPDWVYAEFGIPSTFDSDSLVSSAPDSFTSPTPDSLTSAPSQTTPTPTPPSTTSTIMTPTTYQTLYAASPIAHVHNVTTPVLIFIGEDDLRVCPGQGIGFYHAIRGRAACRESARVSGAKNEAGEEGDGKDGNGKEKQQGIVEMLSFPGETHSTDGVEAARVCWEATRDWFKAFAEGG